MLVHWGRENENEKEKQASCVVLNRNKQAVQWNEQSELGTYVRYSHFGVFIESWIVRVKGIDRSVYWRECNKSASK